MFKIYYENTTRNATSFPFHNANFFIQKVSKIINHRIKTTYLLQVFLTYPLLYFLNLFYLIPIFLRPTKWTILIALYDKLLSADTKIKNQRLKPVFVSPEGPKARAHKTVINLMIFIFLRTGSDPLNEY